jgi:hypothetical protein
LTIAKRLIVATAQNCGSSAAAAAAAAAARRLDENACRRVGPDLSSRASFLFETKCHTFTLFSKFQAAPDFFLELPVFS